MTRAIGMVDRECILRYAPCDPWTHGPCADCSVRPLKVYQGNSMKRTVVDFCNQHGIGIMMCADWRNPEKFPYYSVDNGAFSAWSNDVPWDEEHFLKMLGRARTSYIQPDFVVVPDQVAAGRASLRFSVSWIKRLPEFPGTRYMLAVQDGMEVDDVHKVLKKWDDFGGLFVGGTMGWKLRTSPQWVALAHRHRMPCHIGRVGPWYRIMWAARIGADSIDSTTWVQQDRLYHITHAQMQQTLGGQA